MGVVYEVCLCLGLMNVCNLLDICWALHTLPYKIWYKLNGMFQNMTYITDIQACWKTLICNLVSDDLELRKYNSQNPSVIRQFDNTCAPPNSQPHPHPTPTPTPTQLPPPPPPPLPLTFSNTCAPLPFFLLQTTLHCVIQFAFEIRLLLPAVAWIRRLIFNANYTLR